MASTIVTPTRVAVPDQPAIRCARRARRLAGVREVVLMAALYVGYSLSRLASSDDLDGARESAARLLAFEQGLGIDFEAWASATTAGLPVLAVIASYWYAVLHYVVTPTVLVWIFRRHHSDYARVRSGLVLSSALGLVGFLLLPTAPPRLMPSGFTDVLATYADYGWWSDHASVPAGLGGLSNQLAAMPSLHVGWTLWVAWAVWGKVGTIGRTLAVTYVAGTAIVVVATGNHWVVDAIAGLLVTAVGCGAASLVQRRRDRGRR